MCRWLLRCTMFLTIVKLLISKGSIERPMIHVGFDTAIILPVSLYVCWIRDLLPSIAAAIFSVCAICLARRIAWMKSAIVGVQVGHSRSEQGL